MSENFFKPTIVEASWYCEENNMKNECIVKNCVFLNIFRESSAIKYSLTDAV